jgi:hypothetical protein
MKAAKQNLIILLIIYGALPFQNAFHLTKTITLPSFHIRLSQYVININIPTYHTVSQLSPPVSEPLTEECY